MIDPAFAARWREIHSSANTLIARDIRAAQAADYCPGLDPEIAASALTAMIEQFCLTWQHQNDSPHIEPTDEAAVETLWQLWGHAVYWTDPLPVSTSDE
ncbi:hypothetical protein [Nocardia sp. NBC_01009]|uniref:hypothetical protein n=1 Tax=Nocardia sp. NBC_01009 TaxID=2975996 RepID=UPI00386E30EC|nr:hypothetical protein OHA42_05275 [Nocardia sp. NBC_01009]